MLAPDPALATVPISLMAVGMWIGTLPVGFLAKAFGRRFALQTGTTFGALSDLLSCAAVLSSSFALVRRALRGCTSVVPLRGCRYPERTFPPAGHSVGARRRRFAGVIGSQLVILTKDVWPAYLFAGTYLAQSVCAVIAGAVLTFLRLPRPATARPFAEGRPLADVVRQPRFIAAVAWGLASYMLMNLTMIAAPLAMVMCNHSVGEAALGLQWHVIGIYWPASRRNVQNRAKSLKLRGKACMARDVEGTRERWEAQRCYPCAPQMARESGT
jgi:hypothetical protein